MKYLASNIKHGDIFRYNGCELVATDDYDNPPYLWVTNRDYYLTKEKENEGYGYGYTSACIETIPSTAEVDIIGNMEN